MVQMLRPRLQEIGQRIKPATVGAVIRTRGARWMAIRDRVLSRDAGLCQVCKLARLIRPAYEVDHITELADGGTDELDNLQAICLECHRAKSRQAIQDRAGR